ncbi:MAG: hypothetical protein ACRC4T_18665 [Cetobacterium sp.]
MKYIIIYVKTLIKNLLIVSTLSIILILIFPNVILTLLWFLLIIGSFINASKKVKQIKMNESKENLIKEKEKDAFFQKNASKNEIKIDVKITEEKSLDINPEKMISEYEKNAPKNEIKIIEKRPLDIKIEKRISKKVRKTVFETIQLD